MAHDQAIDVLHLIGALSPGGAERNLCYLAPQFADSKIRYGICCLTEKGELAGEIERAGVPVFELGYRKRYTARTVLRLTHLLKEKRVSVLHTHLFESGVIGRIAAWHARVPVTITHEHGRTLWKRWYHRLFERLAVGGTDLRIAVSEDILSRRVNLEHTPKSKMRIVFNAVDPAPFKIDDGRRRAKRMELGLDNCFVVGTVGRLVEAKSYDLLLDVALEVCAERPDVRFVLVGDGPLADDLKTLWASRGLKDRVLFLGARADIGALMAAMDLYVITSKEEGLPLALIEAMMSSRPIVSTAVGGIPDTLTGGLDGVLVEPGSKDALAAAITALVDDPERRRRLGENARKTAIARFSPRKILAELEAIYTEALARKGITLPTL
jgi:glycosyltransferase involved in cell wall biosynthesis